MFKIDSGIITINISNLLLSGQIVGTSQKTNRGAILFKSTGQSTDPFHGGLWNSRISNILITDFKGHGIYLKGGENNFLEPDQFTIFENVRVFNISDATNSLRITGQNGQITFLNCEFDGYFTKTTQNVYTFKKGVNVWIENVSYYNPAVISFINCTFQYADYGMYLSWAENITIDNCWFEMLGVAILVKSNQISSISAYQPSKSINILNNRFADALGFGSLNAPTNIKAGHCVNVSNSFVNVNNNYVLVTDPNGTYLNSNSRFIVASNNTVGGVYAQGNTFQAEKLSYTFGIMQIIPVVSNTIDCSGNKLVFVTGGASSVVNIIKSSINAGEHLTIRADKGPVEFKNIGNIAFLTSSSDFSFIINNGEVATFIKIDNIVTVGSTTYYETYQLVSLINILS
jgi:hypothetical protein